MKATARKNKSGFWVGMIKFDSKDTNLFGGKQMTIRTDFDTKEEAIEASEKFIKDFDSDLKFK